MGKSPNTIPRAAIVILIMWPTVARAQATLSVASAPFSWVCKNDSNAPAGDITFFTSFVGPSGIGDGSTINAYYPDPISNSPSIPPGFDVTVDATGVFSGQIKSLTVDKANGLLV